MILVFDLDDTLVHSEHEFSLGHPDYLCKATLEVLRYCKENDHVLAMASFNHRAMMIAKQIGIDMYFDVILGEFPRCGTKRPLIDEILEQLNAKTDPAVVKSDVIFFDDCPTNIREMRAYGVKSVRINENTGVTLDDVRKAFEPV